MPAPSSSLSRLLFVLTLLAALLSAGRVGALDFSIDSEVSRPANARLSLLILTKTLPATAENPSSSCGYLFQNFPFGGSTVIFGFPDTTKPSQPVPEFKAQFDLQFNEERPLSGSNSPVAGGISFNYGALSTSDFGSSEAGVGGGLSVAFKVDSQADPQGGAISVYWRGQRLANVTGLPSARVPPWLVSDDSLRGPFYRCYVQVTNGLLTVNFINGSTVMPIVQNQPITWNPEPQWEFGFASVADKGLFLATVGRISISGWTAPYFTTPIADRTSWQDMPDSFTVTLDSLEAVQLANVVVTAHSSDENVIPSTHLQITAPTAHTRRIDLTPLAGAHGEATLTLRLDPGGGLPVGTVTYRQTVNPKIPPSITAFASQYSQPYGVPRSLPFSIGSPYWPASQLQLSVAAEAGLVNPMNIFSQPADDSGTNWNLVFTPQPGQTSGKVSVVVTDGAGYTASSSFTLATGPEAQPPAVLGGGSALAVNYQGPHVVQASQFAVDLQADDTGFGSTATIEAWVYATYLPDPLLNIIAVAGLPGVTSGLILAVQGDGSPSVATWVNDFYPTNAAVKVTTNHWHHVAGVVSGQAVTLYVDGQLSAKGALPRPMDLKPGVVYVGNEPPIDGLNRRWFGFLDHVRIWSTARSAADIAAHFQQTVPPDAPGLVRDFRCDDGFVHFDGANPALALAEIPPGGTLQDSSAQQRHASLVGFPAFVTGVPLTTTVNLDEDTATTIGLGAVVDGIHVWGTAGVTREIYFGAVSSALGTGLLSSPGWPDAPDVVLASGLGLEVPPSPRAGYGQRLRGYLLPPETGTYTLAIASQEEGQLWISSDDSPANLRAVASCSGGPQAAFRHFDLNPAQQSGTVNLTAGRRYYFEVRHQVYRTGGHVSVRWTLPSGLIETPLPAHWVQPIGQPPSGERLNFIVDVPPEAGTLTLTNGTVTYRPTPNYFGLDSFVYRAVNEAATSAPVVVNLNVVNRDDAPVAGSQNALQLDGAGSGFATEDEFNLGGQSFTVELWARRSSTNPPAGQKIETLWSLQSPLASPRASLAWQSDGHLAFQFAGQNSPQAEPPPLVSPVPYLDAEWHHWAATFEGTNRRVELFRDGVSLGATNYGPSVIGVTNVQLFVGSLARAADTEFSGAVDEVRLWNRVRTPTELLAQMAVPLVGSEGGLLAYYRLDEGNGLTAYDSSTQKPGGIRFNATVRDPVTWITGVTNFARVKVPRNSPGQSLFLPGFDFEGQPLTYQIISPSPQNGRLTQTAPGVFTYLPNPNFYGTDTVVYTVSAGGLTSQPTTLFLEVEFLPIPPTISSLRDVEFEEEDPALVIPFAISDVDDPTGNSLTLVARSSNPALLPPDRILFGGAGNSRTVTLDPVEGEVGTSTLELEVSNGQLSAVTQFNVRVNPRLAYVVVNAGATTTQPSSVASALNAAGQLAGWVAGTAAQTNSQPFLYTGYGSDAKAFVTTNLGGHTGGAFGINSAGLIVGASATAQGALHAFSIDPRQNSQPTDLGVLVGGNQSVATGINDEGLIVGYAQVGDGSYRAFTAGTGPLTALPLPEGYVSQWATAVNAAGQIAGYALHGSDSHTNAFLYSFHQNQDLGRPVGADQVLVTALNDEGVVFGHAHYATGAASRAVRWDSGQWTELGDFLGGGQTEVAGANRYGQLVGRALTTNGVWHAFLYTGGRAFDLNALLPADSGWTLQSAAAINDRGQIAATGVQSNRPPQALLLFPATEIGRRVFRPEGTVAELPQITILQGGGNDQPGNSFFWSAVDQKLFAIRPVVAEIKWRTGTYVVVTNLTEFGDTFIRQKYTNEVLLPALSFNVWPNDPDLHVVDTPVQVEPAQPGFQYGFVNLIYTTADGAQVDGSSKIFTSPSTGFSVLQYLKTGGRVPNAQLQPHEFRVARSVLWNDPLHLVTNVAWTIGVPLTNALHGDYPGLNGYPFFTNAPYDGAGLNAAYDRSTRKGALLPVNTDTEAGNLVVVWYQQNRLGVAWSSLPYQYSLAWPTNADPLIIASQLGSGPLSPTQYPQPQIYQQPDPTLPGFNPNEEHALLSGGVLYALRNDLNARVTPKSSDPFVLLKYLDPVSSEWRLKVYSVVDEQAPYFFRYEGVAGEEIQAPLPLSTLPLMRNQNRAVSGPAWQDYLGRYYARAAGLDGGEGDIVMQYFYPLQPDFYFDLHRNGQPEYQPGDPVPWLDRRPGGIVGTPVNITYAIEWPAEVSPLQVGQSLTTATAGLPDITDMAAAQVVFDSLDPTGTQPLNAAARLYDPLSPRTVSLETGFLFPDSVRRSVDPTTGLELFADLPYVLRVRLFHDPRNRLLGFRGYVYTPSDGGAAITLVNVMNSRERETIAALDTSGGTAFRDAVSALYRKTRNPNDVDLDGNGTPDEALLIGLTMQAMTNRGAVITNVVRETLLGAKALTAGQPVPPLSAPAAYAVHFNGSDAAMEVGSLFTNLTDNFTVELWVRPEGARHDTPEAVTGVPGLSGQSYAVYPTQGGTTYGSGHAATGISVGTNGISVFVHSDNLLSSPLVYSTNLHGWHHVAVVIQQRQPLLYLDGALVHVGLAIPKTVHPSADVSRNASSGYGPFTGSVTDLRIWGYPRSQTAIAANLAQRLTGSESGLVGLWRFEENSGSTVANATVASQPGRLVGGFTWTANAPTNPPAHAPAQRYVVVAENNDSSLGGLPVGLHVIRVDDSLARGALAVIQADNVLDERVTLRHTADFAGQPESFVFQWFYQVDADGFSATNVPAVASDGSITNLGAWVPYPDGGAGVNDVTLGTGGTSSLLTLSDSWWVMRYGVTTVEGRTNWSGWVGDPSGTEAAPRAMLVPGWIKRVLSGINLFAQRSSDFENNPVNMLASTIAEAGPRYEGDVALNPHALDDFGLIEIYETVLQRGRNLSIDGTPPVDFPPADAALQLAAGNIADLYLLHANEAFADAADPTIGLTTDSTELGSIASSVFAFENQLDSLLEEELAMLRGRDDRSAGVGAAPVYNRLFWNFTGGDGETAYVAKYGIPDQNTDGFINALDARILYPQGHGDAWGHYLTALTTYYDLLRHPNFTWMNRAQSTLVAGIPIQVNYEDERRFASAAAAKARTGAEIMDRTWRLNYTDEPITQFRGDFDPDSQRAWSTTDWARRAAQGAYFDWIVGNAILPPLDTNHTGIQRVDRTTVLDLAQIVTETATVLTVLDQANAGLNPAGLARGVVPFDIDPDQLRTGFSRVTHFEQVYQRALQALQNAEVTFNRASLLSSELRKQQNSVSDFSVAVTQQELDYKNQLLALFGYPYAGTIGAGQPYPAGYDGPDLTYWMYVDTLEVTPANNPRGDDFLALQGKFTALVNDWGAAFSGETVDLLNPSTNRLIEVEYPVSTANYAFQAPSAWGARRAEGQLQAKLRALVLAQAQLRQDLRAYEAYTVELEEQADLLNLRYGLQRDQIRLINDKGITTDTFNALIHAAQITKVVAEGVVDDIEEVAEAIERAVPDVLGLSNDALAELGAAIYLSGHFASSIPEKIAEGAEIIANILEFSKELAVLEIERETEVNQQNFEVTERLKELEGLVRQEPALRLGLFQASQGILQAARDLEATLAEGQRVLVQRTVFRQATAGSIQAARYRDLGLRIFRNDALEKYDAQFELASRYVHLAAAAYDYELNLGTDTGAGSVLGSQIVRERNLGELADGQPIVGRVGLASLLGRMRQNFDVLKGQLGLNNDRPENSRFSLRTEAFRILPAGTNTAANTNWRTLLQQSSVSNLWDVPEFRRYCRSFAPESAGAQPGLVLRFGSTVQAGRNFFDQPLGPLDSSYDPSEYSTRIKSMAVWFSDYDAAGLAAKPRVYLVPAGADRLRSSTANDFTVRDWQVLDQRIPVPFPITAADLAAASSLPTTPALDGSFTEIRRHSAFRAYQDATFDLNEFSESSRLVGRSVWNTQWVIIIPGAYLLGDPTEGLTRFINSVSDVKLYFQTYSASGN